MNEAENKTKIELTPIVSIAVIILVLAVAGLFFYKSLVGGLTSEDVVEPVVTVTQPAIEQPTEVLKPEEELLVLEQELEEITVDIDNEDLFGLDDLDAELIDFDELDALLDFEL